MSRESVSRNKPVIGLVGGVGAGKSQVARQLESLGAAVIDSDRLAHAVLAEPSVRETLTNWWGSGVRLDDGAIDRRALARIVFEQPEQLARLEALLYPLIEQHRQRLMPGLLADDRVCAIVLDAPKLYEAGLETQCDVVLFVDSGRHVRLQRVGETRGWSEDELDRREKLQFSLDKKRARADYIISNNSTLECLRIEVGRVFALILGTFRKT